MVSNRVVALLPLLWLTHAAVGTAFELELVHVNDHHSHLHGTTLDVPVPDVGDVEVAVGGYPRIISAISEYETAAQAASRAFLKLHAGDAITGTSYYTMFKGEVDADMMDMVCFDAFAVGNHEFDDGDANLAHFITRLRNTTCPDLAVLAANVVPGPTSPLTGMFNGSKVFTVAGETVGVVGINIANKTMQSSQPDAGTTLSDERAAAQHEIDLLTASGVDKIILLTHVGYTEDLAWMAGLRGVDVVIGGDSHSLLGDSNTSAIGLNVEAPYPTTATNGDGQTVCVATAWEYAKAVGHLMVTFDDSGNVLSCSGSTIFAYDATSMEMDGAALSEANVSTVNAYLDTLGHFLAVQPNEAATNALTAYDDQVGPRLQTVIAEVPDSLCFERIPNQGRSTICDVAESNMHGGAACQLVAKAFLHGEPTAHIAIQNGGGCRTDIAAGNFTLDDAITMLPFSNTLVTLELTGQLIKDLLEEALEFALNGGSTGAYPYAAGLRFHVNASTSMGNRISNLEVNPRLMSVWEPIDLMATYTILTNSFIAAGRDGYETFNDATSVVDTFVEYSQGLVRYAEEFGHLIAPPLTEFSTQAFTDASGTVFSTGTHFGLNILHINDHHSHLSGETLSVDTPTQAVRLQVGGFPRLVSAIHELEMHARIAGHGVLKLHAGDAITGTSFYSLFRGTADAAMMQHVCFDAFALGNHEFDDGDANLAHFIDMVNNASSPCGSLPILAANVVPGQSSPLQGLLQASHIFIVNGYRVGVIGIDIMGKTMQSSSPSEGTVLTDERTAAQTEIDSLISAGVNKIVLLTHIGYEEDLDWMAGLNGVDVIVGADSHSLLGNDHTSGLGLNVAGTYPTTMTNGNGGTVCIVQAWEYTKAIGNLQVVFDDAGNVVSCGGSPAFPYDPMAILDSDREMLDEAAMMEVRSYLDGLNGHFIPAMADPHTQMDLQVFEDQVETLRQTVIAQVPEVLCFERMPGQGRSTLCDVEASRANGGAACQVVAKAFMTITSTADISIQNAGGCRTDIDMGPYTIDDAYTMLPFSNTLVLVEATGAQIKALLEAALDFALSPEGSTGAYPYASGLRFHVDITQPQGSRFSGVEVNSRLAGSWMALDMTANYTIVTNSFIAGGRDGYTTFNDVADSIESTYIEYAEGLIRYSRLVGELVKPDVSEFSTQMYTSERQTTVTTTSSSGSTTSSSGSTMSSSGSTMSSSGSTTLKDGDITTTEDEITSTAWRTASKTLMLLTILGWLTTLEF